MQNQSICVPRKTMGAAVLLFFCSLLLLAPDVHSQEWIYTVRPGENPWSISKKYLEDMRYWPRLQTLNKIDRPNQIPPGRRLRIPFAWIKPELRPVPVRVLDVRGTTQLDSIHHSNPLQAGMPLQAGDIIRTGPEGNALLEFADGSRLLVQANSNFEIDTVRVYERGGTVDTDLRLRQGRLETQVTPRRDRGARYQIRTPSAVSVVRGTSYRLGTDADQVTRAEVLTGALAVSSDGKTATVPERFGTLSKTSGGPLAPVELLPAPDLSGLPGTMDKLEFSWPSLDGAVAYRVQLLGNPGKRYKLLVFNKGELVHTEQSSEPEFQALLVDNTLDSTHFQGPKLPNNNYLLRIRGIDEQGLEGLNKDHDFSLFDTTP